MLFLQLDRIIVTFHTYKLQYEGFTGFLAAAKTLSDCLVAS